MSYRQKHLLAIEGLHPPEIGHLLDFAESYVLLNRSGKTQRDLLRGRTLINLFFEDSTRTRTSFELAGKRLGADVINMSVSTSSVNKGETLLDTAATLNAMHCDLLVVRHDQSGAPNLLAQKVDAAVINAGDGTHEHPTQALLDALTIRRRKGRLEDLIVAICGDVPHSRVARSNIHLLTTMGSRVRVIGPPTLIPAEVQALGVEVFHDMEAGLAGRGHRDDAAAAAGAHAARTGAQCARIFPLLRPGCREAGVRQAGRAGDASRADEPRRGDRQRGGRRSGAQPDPRTGRDGRRGAHGGAGYAVARPGNDVCDTDTLFVGVRLLDPACGLDQQGDLLVRDGAASPISAPASAARTARGDAGGRRGAVPRAGRYARRARRAGYEYRETIASAAQPPLPAASPRWPPCPTR